MLLKCEIMSVCDLEGGNRTLIYKENARKKVFSFIMGKNRDTWNRTVQRQTACGQKCSKSSQELNRNSAAGGSILDFTLSSTGLIYSVWRKIHSSTCTVGARAQLQSLMWM